MDQLREQRQNRSHQLRHDDRSEQGHRDDECIAERIGIRMLREHAVHQNNPGAVDGPEHQPHDRGDPEFLPDYPSHIPDGHFSQRQSAHHQRTDLIAAVARRIHQHRHEGNQQRDRVEGRLVVLRHHARERSGQHQDQQPGNPLLRVLPYAGSEIACRLVLRDDRGHLLHVLGGLVHQDVHRIVNRDDSDQHALIIHDRHRVEVVLRELMRHILLVVRHLDADQILVHQITDRRVRIIEQQIAGADDALQPVFVHHIAGIHRLGVRSLLPDFLQRLTDGEVLPEPDVLGRHD